MATARHYEMISNFVRERGKEKEMQMKERYIRGNLGIMKVFYVFRYKGVFRKFLGACLSDL